MSDIIFSVVINQAEFARAVTKGVHPTVKEVAFAIEAAMKLSMTGQKSGREYKRHGRTHIASAPGEAPAVDTGFLINSIQTDIKSETEAVITIGAEYAATLEFQKNRPFVRPAIDGVLRRVGQGGILATARE
jgi:hypothetical protein